MSGKTAVLLGSSGMIGSYLFHLLLTDDYFDTVKILVRRPTAKINPKIEVKLVNYDDTESVKLALENADVVFSCIGTTQKNVKGDRELYRKIDFEVPLMAARFSKETGCEKFIFVSSVGADSHSSTFYLRLKGELENAIRATGLDTIHIMQPSLLLGERKEKRFGETILQKSMILLSGLFLGSWRKYKAIHGNTVAIAMLNAAKKEDRGFFRYSFDEINLLAGKC